MTRGTRGTLVVALVGLILSVVHTALGGQDLNFDFITYHFYLGYSTLHGGFAANFLPASFQGYQSPLPYALLYLLESAGVPPLASATLAAGIHSLNLLLLWLLARLLVAGTSLEGDRLALVAVWLLGAVAPLYWQLVGTSFADLQASVLVLAALWLLARSLPVGERPLALRSVAASGALVGLAVAMRVHTAIFAVSLAAALVLCPVAPGRERLRALLVLGAAGAGAWLLCYAPWGLALYREFGSPVFPFYNAVFRSPDFPPFNLQLASFVPGSIGDALMLPFRMATYREWLYAEKPAPDVRPGLLVVAAVAAMCASAYARLVRRPSVPPPGVAGARRLVLLFFVFSVLLWLPTSAHGRYGVALFLLAGPVCGVLLARVLPERRHVILVIAAALAWQLMLQQVFFRQSRWAAGPWAERYFDWAVPDTLAREPALYLSFGYKTASSLAPRLHPASRHASLVGQYSVDLDHPGAQRLHRLIASGRRTYGVFDFKYTQQPDPASRSIKRYFAEHLRRWGLDFTAEPCTLVPLREPSAAWRRVNDMAGIRARGAPPEFIVCELRRAANEDRARALAEYADFRRKLAPFAAACPKLLEGALSIVRVHGQWWVSSVASLGYRLDFPDAGVFYLQLLGPPYTAATVGTIGADGIRAVPGCDRWVARLVQADRAPDIAR